MKYLKYNTSNEWVEIFKEEYNRIKPTGAKQFNLKRKEGIPAWTTIASMVNLKKWNDLIKYCGLCVYRQERRTGRRDNTKKEFIIKRRINVLDLLEKTKNNK